MTPTSWLRTSLRQGRRALAGIVRRFQDARPTPHQTGATPANRLGLTSYEVRLRSGLGPAFAAAGATRECLENGNVAGGLRLGYTLAKSADTAEVADAVLGLCHRYTSAPEYAWQRFRRLTDPEVLLAASPEYFRTAFAFDREGAQRAAALLLGRPRGLRLTAHQALKIGQNAFAFGSLATARDLAEAAGRGDFGKLDDQETYEFRRMATWFPEGSRRERPALPAADLRFGVLDYKQPGNDSQNVGDFIQTLASLGHLVRHERLTFVGDPALVDFVTGLRPNVKPERRLTEATGRVQLLELHRDGNTYQELPEPIWAFLFGWYMHPTWASGFKFPFNPAIRPLFISFHANKPEMLTPDGVAYLKRYAPIGCRDWQTVAMLRAAGIPAFFSGCITTTVDTLFPLQDPDTRERTAFIDVGQDEGSIEQSVDDIRARPLPANLALAYDWVSSYHQQYRRVVTSRLHSYLPARSVGCEVTFEPANRSDPRFGGLIDIDDAAFEAMRQGILAKLATVVELLLSGAGEDEVYRRWAELCAADLAAADVFLAGHALPTDTLPRLPETDLADLAEDRVILIDAPLKSRAAVARLVESLADHAPGIPVIAVGQGARDLPPGVRCITDSPLVERGSTSQHHDLLVADALTSLPDRATVLLLPGDAVIRGDLGGLFDTELGTATIACRPEIRRYRQNLNVVLRRISARQGPDWKAALGFLAASHARCGAPRSTFDPRVALIDCGRLAEAGWDNLSRGLIEVFGATLGEALNIVLAGRHVAWTAAVDSNVALEEPAPGTLILTGLAQARLGAAWFLTAKA